MLIISYKCLDKLLNHLSNESYLQASYFILTASASASGVSEETQDIGEVPEESTPAAPSASTDGTATSTEQVTATPPFDFASSSGASFEPSPVFSPTSENKPNSDVTGSISLQLEESNAEEVARLAMENLAKVLREKDLEKANTFLERFEEVLPYFDGVVEVIDQLANVR